MIKAVVFDRGGTLIRERSGEEVLYEILNPMGFHLTPVLLNKAEEASRAHWREKYQSLPRGQRWTHEIRRDCLEEALKTLALPGDEETQQDLLRRLDEYWDAFRILGLYAGVRPCLGALAAERIPLGVLGQTLRSSIEVRAELERLGVGRYFRTVVSVEDTEWDKPDPRLFKLVAEKLGLPSGEVLFVGDDYERDAGGARAAGMVPLIVDRHDAVHVNDVTVVRSLAQIPGVLPSLSKGPTQSVSP
ncbi:MAG: HAD family hydrolase [Euryarchaeota archaeon]|nr:HAD family hydrolase [Euryarchaeota archaeon]MDE1835999.1 HAD family hydrolase [Euryarchaeota archaeon]MDE1880959.1 HAD family hydrolase [Euryarchaeota archaeon]MDE2046009.1 HAD family hydrolase [Thermoplasmata archaeon]